MFRTIRFFQRTLATEAATAKRPLRIVYGSQTGTATMLAQLLAKAAKKKQFAPEVRYIIILILLFY